MTTLYLVRHGETVDNARQVMQGQTQGALNERGIKQAEEVAERMASVAIDAFVSSDLKRSYDTCAIIVAAHITAARVSRIFLILFLNVNYRELSR